MPESNPENKDWVLQLISQITPKSVLDIGCGSGIYGLICRKFEVIERLDAIEVWTPYLSRFKLEEIYDNVYNCDARRFQDFDYDLVILGDVLEHMPIDDAVNLWGQISENARNSIISVPIVHYPQGEVDGNPFEKHITEDWSVESVIFSFRGINYYRKFDTTGVFYANFEKTQF